MRRTTAPAIPVPPTCSYAKASNTGPGDEFGRAVALDGDALVVGAWSEDSGATGVGGNEADDSAAEAGAVYAFD